MEAGEKVRFTNVSDEQVKWGSNTDPRGLLLLGEEYEVENVDVHSWHTKVTLVGINGKFNSAHFN